MDGLPPLTCEQEEQRISRLKALAVLDTAPEPMFDAITKAAAIACGMPIALVSLVDEKRQWFKSNYGLPGVTETKRDIAFCAHALVSSQVMVVSDAHEDDRFRANPLVTGAPYVRFYAGSPIRLNDGTTLGTLCVLDRQVRDLSPEQIKLLEQLADAVAGGLEFRKRAVDALSSANQSEMRLAHLYASTPAMLYSVDHEGRILTASETWLSELGYTRKDVLGMRSIDLLTEASRQRVIDSIYPEFYRSGMLKNAELQMVRGDGQILDVLVSAVLERDEEGRPVRNMAVIENITARRQAERDLQRERERMYGVLDGTDAGTWEWNIATGETLVNQRWAEIVGFRYEELDPKLGWFELIHPADHIKVQEAASSHLNRHAERFEVDLRVQHKDGHWVWVHDRGRITSWTDDGKAMWMQGVRLDITTRKENEEALRASQSFLMRTGDLAGVGGWEVDLLTNTLVWSDATCRLHDVEPGHRPTLEEALQYGTPESRPLLAAAMQRGIDEGKPWDLEVPFISAKGRHFWARAVGSVEFEDDRPVRLVGAFQDVTFRKSIELQLQENEELLQVTLESIADGVITTDPDSNVRWLNPVAEHLTGWTKEAAEGRPLEDIFVIVNATTRRPLRNPVTTCLATDEQTQLVNHTLLISKDGSEYGIEDTASPIRDAEGEVHGAVLVFRDVSEQRRLHQEMSHRATHDPLTGLPNRTEFHARLEQLLLTSREHRDHAVLYIDLDHFKQVNDARGHAAGDQLLRQIANLFKKCLRGRDTVARLGGDEFGVILDRVDLEQAQTIAQKICDTVGAYRFVQEGESFQIGASVGLVLLPIATNDPDSVVRIADACCYKAKQHGRNQVHIHRP